MRLLFFLFVGVVSLVKFHPDAKRLHLYSCADDTTIRVYDLYAKKYVCLFFCLFAS